jgi:hypothetical protein
LTVRPAIVAGADNNRRDAMTHTTRDEISACELSIEVLEPVTGGAATLRGFLQAVADGAAAGASLGMATGSASTTLAGAATGGAAGGIAYLHREGVF